jgi:hypothetical protein
MRDLKENLAASREALRKASQAGDDAGALEALLAAVRVTTEISALEQKAFMAGLADLCTDEQWETVQKAIGFGWTPRKFEESVVRLTMGKKKKMVIQANGSYQRN